MHYLCTTNDEISLRQIKIHRGMEQLVARRAHNPKVVWFESHSRYSKTVSDRFFLYLQVGNGCCLSQIIESRFKRACSLSIICLSLCFNLQISLSRVALWLVVTSSTIRAPSKLDCAVSSVTTHINARCSSPTPATLRRFQTVFFVFAGRQRLLPILESLDNHCQQLCVSTLCDLITVSTTRT